MPFEIGKLPRGLSGALALRSQGHTPQTLADQAVLTLEAFQLYLLDVREAVQTFTQTNPVLGNNLFSTPMVVPAGELWYVWNYVCACQTGAGETLEMYPAVNFDGLAITSPVGDLQSALAANEQIRAFNRAPFWAGPGSEFGFLAKSLTATPTINAAAVVTKLRI